MGKRFKMKTVADVLHWEPFLEADQIEALKNVACPARIGGRSVPQSLDDITLGSLFDLETIGAEKGVFAAIGHVFLGMTESEVLKAPALELLGLRNMVLREQERIAGMFASLAREHTAAELMAGVESLNFGLFGLVDWYARRMGITDHDEALRTPWIRVWQCRKNDIEEGEYRRRLQQAENDLSRQRR